MPPFDERMSRLDDAFLNRADDRATALPTRLFALVLDMLGVFVISLLLVTNRAGIRRPAQPDDVAAVLDRRARLTLLLEKAAVIAGGDGT